MVAFYTGTWTDSTYTASMYSREIVLSEAMFISFFTLERGDLQLMVTNDDLDYVVWKSQGFFNDWEKYCVNIDPTVVGMPRGAVRLQFRSLSATYSGLSAAITNITLGYGRCSATPLPFTGKYIY